MVKDRNPRVWAGGKRTEGRKPLLLNAEGQLTVSSLAHCELTASIPVSKTNFEPAIRERFALATKEANERLQEMRDVDASYFRENNRDFEVLKKAGSLWDESSDDDFLSVQTALDQKLNRSGFKAVAFFRAQDQIIDEDGQDLRCKTIVVLLRGKDNGFGSYRWRSIVYLRGSNIMKWQDFPDDAVQKARKTEQR